MIGASWGLFAFWWSLKSTNTSVIEACFHGMATMAFFVLVLWKFNRTLRKFGIIYPSQANKEKRLVTFFVRIPVLLLFGIFVLGSVVLGFSALVYFFSPQSPNTLLPLIRSVISGNDLATRHLVHLLVVSPVVLFVFAVAMFVCAWMLWRVHHLLNLCCWHYAVRYCRKNDLEFLGGKVSPAFKNGVKTEYTAVMCKCRDATGNLKLVCVIAWIFGIREVVLSEFPTDQEESFNTLPVRWIGWKYNEPSLGNQTLQNNNGNRVK